MLKEKVKVFHFPILFFKAYMYIYTRIYVFYFSFCFYYVRIILHAFYSSFINNVSNP